MHDKPVHFVRFSDFISATWPSLRIAALSGFVSASFLLAGCSIGTSAPDRTRPVSTPVEKSKLAHDGARFGSDDSSAGGKTSEEVGALSDINKQASVYAAQAHDAIDESKRLASSPNSVAANTDNTRGNDQVPSTDKANVNERKGANGVQVQWVGEQHLKMAPHPKNKTGAKKVASEPNEAKAKTVDVGASKGAVEQKTEAGSSAVKPVATVPATDTKSVADRKQPVYSSKKVTVNQRNLPSREQLISQLQHTIATSSDPVTVKAMRFASAALASPNKKVDAQALALLTPSQQALVRQFHALFSTLEKQVVDGGTVDRQKLASQIDGIVGEQPLSIRKAHVCRRVRGYGVFDTMSTDMIVGREHPVVIYTELDHFATRATDPSASQYQVKVSQQLVLYNESDGLAVWRQDAETIVDESRNRRRDFFVVQPTRLPARLSVGKYVLKVTVRDLLGGTRDEASIPIHVVADPQMVRPNVGAAKKKERRG